MESKNLNSQPNILKFNKDAIVLMEGELNPGFIFIVRSGVLKIDTKIKFAKPSMNQYTQGDVFGFVSAILKQKHQQNIIAATETEVLRLTVSQFLVFIRQKSDSFVKFLSYYTEKLRVLMDVNNKISGIQGFDASPEQLIVDAKFYSKIGFSEKSSYALNRYLTSEFSLKKRPEKIKEAQELLNSMDPKYEYIPPAEKEEGMVEYRDGQIIFLQNEPDDYMYVIVSGGVVLTMIKDDSEIILDTIYSGEIFGEMAILNKKARIATATAKGDTVLKRYNMEALLSKAADEVLIKIFFILAKRFHLANQRILIKKVEDINLKFYLQIFLLISEKMNEVATKKTEFKIDYTLDQVGSMLGIQTISKEQISELIKDKSIKLNEDHILILNGEDFEHKVTIMKQRYSRTMRDTII